MYFEFKRPLTEAEFADLKHICDVRATEVRQMREENKPDIGLRFFYNEQGQCTAVIRGNGLRAAFNNWLNENNIGIKPESEIQPQTRNA